MNRLGVAVVIALTWGAGCRDAPDDRKARAPAGPPEIPAAPATPPVISEAEARALVDAWVTAQNRGDFHAYEALYARKFSGVRRSGQQIARMNRTDWLVDRRRMFAAPMRVEIAALRVVPSRSGVTVGFEQTWSSRTYKDIGPKVMVLSREDGALRIEREEMLSSRRLPLDAPPVATTASPAPSATSFRGQPSWVVVGGGFDMDHRSDAAQAARQLIDAGVETTVVDTSLFDDLTALDFDVVLVHGAFDIRARAQAVAAGLRSRGVNARALHTGGRTSSARLVRVLGDAADPAGQARGVPVAVSLEDARGTPVGTAATVTDATGWYHVWVEVPASAVSVEVEGDFELDLEASRARGCHGWIGATVHVSSPVPVTATDVEMKPIAPFEDCCGE